MQSNSPWPTNVMIGRLALLPISGTKSERLRSHLRRGYEKHETFCEDLGIEKCWIKKYYELIIAEWPVNSQASKKTNRSHASITSELVSRGSQIAAKLPPQYALIDSDPSLSINEVLRR